MRRLLCLVALVLLCPSRVDAKEDVDYGRVPDGLQAIIVTQNQRALGTRALRLLEEAEHGAPTWDHVSSFRGQLVLLDAPGLRLIAERLCAGATSRWFRSQLCAAVAESEHEAADLLLAIAATEPGAALRMVAAEGLGRGRTPHAVTVLETLSKDAVPGVRMVALRALFAIDSPHAREARIVAPRDVEPMRLARRLAWHRRAGDADPRIVKLAADTLATGKTANLRLASAAYLADPVCGRQVAAPLLERLIEELGSAPLFLGAEPKPIAPPRPGPRPSSVPAEIPDDPRTRAWLRRTRRKEAPRQGRPARTVALDVLGKPRLLGNAFRARRGIAPEGYDPVIERQIAVQAALTLLDRPGLPMSFRRRIIERSLDWIAHPISMDPYQEDPIPEHALLRRLPDLGHEVMPYAVAALEAGEFASPQHGFLLLRELGPAVALPWVREYIERLLADGLRHPHRFSAACDALADLGQIGDEDLARRLFLELPESLGGARTSIRTDVGTALRTDPAPWVVPLVARGLDSKNDEVEAEAHRVLVARTEDSAWEARTHAFFRRPTRRGHDRLRALVWKGDARAAQTLERAFADKRRVVWHLALRQFTPRNQALHDTERFLPMIHALEPRLKSAYEVQDYVYALLILKPAAAVEFVRRRWDSIPRNHVTLRQLQEVRGKRARHDAIDLALEKAIPDAPISVATAAAAVLKGQWKHRPADVEAFWRRLLQPGHPRRMMALRMIASRGAPDLTDLLLPMIDQLWKDAAPPEEGTDGARDEQIDHLIDALGYQPRDKVETLLVEAALDPLLRYTARGLALRHLKGNISDAARRRLMLWAGYVLPTEAAGDPSVGVGADDDVSIHWRIAEVVGFGAKSDIAAALLRTLDGDLLSWAQKQPPFEEADLQRTGERRVAGKLKSRIVSATRAIAETRHKPTISALIDRLFHPEVVRVIRERAGAFAYAFDWAGPGAAARRPSHPTILNYGAEAPAEVALEVATHILGQLRILPDAELAPLMKAALVRANDAAVLARAPDIYPALLSGQFLDRRGGACPKTAAVLLEQALRTSPRDSAVEHRAMSWMIDALEEREDFEGALALEERRVRIVARRALGRAEVDLLLLRRTHRDALRGVVFARAGKHAEARAAFSRALLRAPHDSNTLNTVAWYLFKGDLDLGLAEDLARRAGRLQRRTTHTMSLDVADTLACVLMARGKAAEGLEVLESRMRASGDTEIAAYHLHWAQLLLAVGEPILAEQALERALMIDRRLAERLAGDRRLAQLKDRFDALVRRAEKARWMEEW